MTPMHTDDLIWCILMFHVSRCLYEVIVKLKKISKRG